MQLANEDVVCTAMKCNYKQNGDMAKENLCRLFTNKHVSVFFFYMTNFKEIRIRIPSTEISNKKLLWTYYKTYATH